MYQMRKHTNWEIQEEIVKLKIEWLNGKTAKLAGVHGNDLEHDMTGVSAGVGDYPIAMMLNTGMIRKNTKPRRRGH